MTLLNAAVIGTIVSLVEQLSKNDIVPIPVNDYPRVVQWLLCAVVSAGYLYYVGQLTLGNWAETGIKILGASYLAYRTLVERI